MAVYTSYFAGKRITLMGLGLLGRGVGDARFLAPLCKELIVTDLKSEAELADSLAQLKEFANITYHLGGHRLEDFKERDLILKAAGVPYDSAFIAEAKKNKIPVRMSADLFAEFSGVAVVGVTGTRGKSTVSHMLAHVLEAAHKKVFLGGNVKGVSTLAALAEVTPDTIAVLELDSWQLQGFGEAKLSPHVSVFTTFMPDHMNYYGGSMPKYFADKANIFLNQSPEDTLVLGQQVVPFVEEYGYKNKIQSRTVIASEKNFPKKYTLSIPGEHNRYSAGVAITAAEALGLDTAAAAQALEHFKGVPGRLELIRDIKGVKIYNDTTATVPEATIAGIRALSGESKEKRVILIMGGSDKGLDMTALWVEIQNRCKDLYFLAGSGIDRIRPEAPHVPIYNSLKEVLGAALAGAEAGDTILFSPAFASFGMFKNEYDRGEQFNQAVSALR